MLVQACGIRKHGVHPWRRLRGQRPETHLMVLKKAIYDKDNLGPEIADDMSDVMQGRIVEWKEHSVDVEAGPRHVKKNLEGMRMEECNGSDVAG